MTFDWQTVAVALIIFAACLYVARRAAMRLRSLRPRGAGDPASACETGCGSCGGEPKQTRPAPALVQIDRSRKGAKV